MGRSRFTRSAAPNSNRCTLPPAAFFDALHHVPDGDLVGEIVANALKLLRDQTNRGDVSFIDKSFKELRYALKIFAPYRDVRKVSIFGSRRRAETAPEYQQAAEFGRAMAQAGWMVITSGGEESWPQATEARGQSPPSDWQSGSRSNRRRTLLSRTIPKLINFKYFFTRKLMLVHSSHAVANSPRRKRNAG